MATDGIERGVAVFGSAVAEEGSPEWERAEAVGAEIARRGLPTVTGGYGGVMEAASRGARRAGGEVIGVTCRLFRGRSPNPHLTLEIEEPDLATRTARLFALAKGFVVLGGGVGTLAELALLWADAKAGSPRGPIVIWDDVWARAYGELEAAGRMEAGARRWTRLADRADAAVALALDAHLH